MSFSNTEAVTVDPLELNKDFDSMIKNSTGNIIAIVVLGVIALILIGLIIFLSISNSKKFAAVDYESDEDEPSEEENMQQDDNQSDGMSTISGDHESREGEAHGSNAEPQVGSMREDFSVNGR